ncbi:MAG: hypothetical protein JWQ14_2808, partial [Adhaeribacter sp.]|nr:hypothetical protein [Adhaeribacter sp.]
TQNLHLTLHFLGTTPPDALLTLTQKLQMIAAVQQSFELSFKEIAPGPQLKSPRLVWVRLLEHPAFTQLATTIRAAVGAQAEEVGEYIPHITIARLKKERRTTLLSLPLLRDIYFPPFPVQNFSIWQSELGSPHPHYRILESFALAPTDK